MRPFPWRHFSKVRLKKVVPLFNFSEQTFPPVPSNQKTGEEMRGRRKVNHFSLRDREAERDREEREAERVERSERRNGTSSLFHLTSRLIFCGESITCLHSLVFNHFDNTD